MLVLTRRRAEKLMIGDDIVVTVCSIDRGKVRLGIEAPPGVPVMREELVGTEKEKGIRAGACEHGS